MITATCPECKAEIVLGSIPDIGKRTVCSACSTELEVVWLYPPMLDYIDDECQVAGKRLGFNHRV